MNKEKPLISIIIVTYNPKRTIKKCLESIHSQTYKNIEVIVVDAVTFPEEKRKEYQEIIKKHAKLYIDGPERSIQRNRGIQEAKGEYVLVLDQDMYVSPKVVEDCLETIKHGYIALTIPEISIGEGYWTKCVALERYITTYLEEGMNECCRFFKKKDALAIGGFDTTIVGVEDSDFHYRMKKQGSIGKAKEVIHHDEGKTSFLGRIKKKYYYSRAFRKYLERYPGIATAQFFPIKSAYIKHFDEFVKHPFLTFGIIALRSGEVFAGFLGIMLKG